MLFVIKPIWFTKVIKTLPKRFTVTRSRLKRKSILFWFVRNVLVMVIFLPLSALDCFICRWRKYYLKWSLFNNQSTDKFLNQPKVKQPPCRFKETLFTKVLYFHVLSRALVNLNGANLYFLIWYLFHFMRYSTVFCGCICDIFQPFSNTCFNWLLKSVFNTI